jgi:hypothetical protein
VSGAGDVMSIRKGEKLTQMTLITINTIIYMSLGFGLELVTGGVKAATRSAFLARDRRKRADVVTKV